MSDLFTDADVERGDDALPDLPYDVAEAVLTATLPAIRARWLNELADYLEFQIGSPVEPYDVGWCDGLRWAADQLRAKAGEER